MYAGTTFYRGSGKITGAHQKIDRIARRRLSKYISKTINFPDIKNIIYFEGINGPDGLKLKGRKIKTPLLDDPKHAIDPTKSNDRALLVIIDSHINNLAKSLADNNNTRAAFEAAWLAHAVTDGLTPAHHHPPRFDKIEHLWDKSYRKRSTINNADTNRRDVLRDMLSKNWKYLGAVGVFGKHLMFEWGITSIVAANKFKTSGPSGDDIKHLKQEGFETLFMESLHKIHAMKMYDEFAKNGWTRRLASETKKVLVPEIIKIVTLAWYQAVVTVTEPS